MQNLDQVRAAHALNWLKKVNIDAKKPVLVRRDAAKLPAMLLSNGLLATFAFACEEGKAPRSGLKKACEGIAVHLGQSATGISELAGITSPETLTDKLAQGDAFTLQRATAEALAYLSYLKRYAPKKDKVAH
jgi:CRISPR type III-B/RAMP module-associated protein Cmr5